MAFIVEDGTGLPNANSYVDVQEYRDYATDRGIDVTAELEATIQGYLVRSTDYVNLTYTFVGEQTTDTQSLAFPRTYNEVDLGLPVNVVNATIEMAFQVANGVTLFNDNTKNIISKKEKVDVIETEIKYDVTNSIYMSNASRFPTTEAYLKPYIDIYATNNGQVRVTNG